MKNSSSPPSNHTNTSDTYVSGSKSTVGMNESAIPGGTTKVVSPLPKHQQSSFKSNTSTNTNSSSTGNNVSRDYSNGRKSRGLTREISTSSSPTTTSTRQVQQHRSGLNTPSVNNVPEVPIKIRRSSSNPSLKVAPSPKNSGSKIAVEERQQRHAGVLYKRRDVFRNQWRPRFFVLSRESGMLNYYLVPNNNHNAMERSQSMSLATMDDTSVADASYRSTIGNTNTNGSTPTGPPRGSFYLPGCTVYVNDKVSRAGKYYAFTIITNGADAEETVDGAAGGTGMDNSHSNSNAASIHLATRTNLERMQWVQRLSPVCSSQDNQSNPNHVNMTHSNDHELRNHSNVTVDPTNLQEECVEEEEEDDEREEEEDEEDDADVDPVTSQQEEESSSEESGNLPEDMHLHDNVPVDIRTLIDEKMRRTLHFFRESTNRGNQWKPCFRRKNVNAFQKRRRGAPPLIRVESFINQHPCLLLQYLLDIRKRTNYDTNLRLANRLKVFNHHTFLDYCAYKPIRSIAARDFCVVTHWRVLPNKSILYVSFSFPEDKFCPLDLDHVRADFLCNAFLLQPSAMNSANSCFVKRIFSTDLNGKVPTSVVNTFTLQQIRLLSCLNSYLETIQAPQPTNPDISSDAIVNEIIQPLIQPDAGNNYSKCREMGMVVASSIVKRTPRSSSDPTTTKAKTQKYISFPFWLIVASGLLLILPSLCIFIYKWILIPIYQHILFIFFLPLTGLLILQNCNGIAYHKHSQYARTNQRHNFVVHFPFFIDGCVLFFPVVAYHLATTSAPLLREIVFVVSLFVSLRSFLLSKIGPRFKYSDGSHVPMSGHSGLGTGLVTCRFDIELKGILRYISAKKEERKQSNTRTTTSNERLDEPPINPKNAEIAVTHIVIKAAARAISEFPVFNGYKLSIPMLAIQGYFPYRQIDISVAKGIHRSSSESNHTSKLCIVDQLTIKDIAMQVAMKISPTQKQSANQTFMNSFLPKAIISNLSNLFQMDSNFSSNRDFGSCVILTSPNSENSDVEIDVAPSLSSQQPTPTIVIVVGGVRVLSQAMNKSSRSSSSSNAARPFLHMSISMNCPASSIATCRKFAERIQKLAQFPEICDEIVE